MMKMGGSHSLTKASTVYLAKAKQIMANWEGFNTKVQTQLNMKAGSEPNAW
jgi:hypothetical protein